jgi:hypothetical protein
MRLLQYLGEQAKTLRFRCFVRRNHRSASHAPGLFGLPSGQAQTRTAS